MKTLTLITLTLALASVSQLVAQETTKYESMYSKLKNLRSNTGSAALGLATSGDTTSTRSRASGILRDFYSAALSENVGDAERKWKAFRAKYTLPGGEFEDGSAAHMCEWSDAEIKRCQAIASGKSAAVSAAERLLKNLAKKIER